MMLRRAESPLGFGVWGFENPQDTFAVMASLRTDNSDHPHKARLSNPTSSKHCDNPFKPETDHWQTKRVLLDLLQDASYRGLNN